MSRKTIQDFQKILEEFQVMKINTDVQFAIMAEEIKTLKKKDHKYKSKASSSKKYSSSEDERPRRDSLRATEHYQHIPYHHLKRERKSKEIRVDLPHFHGTNDIDTFLDWEMKVEQLFECYEVSEEKKVPQLLLVSKDMYCIGGLP